MTPSPCSRRTTDHDHAYSFQSPITTNRPTLPHEETPIRRSDLIRPKPRILSNQRDKPEDQALKRQLPVVPQMPLVPPEAPQIKKRKLKEQTKPSKLTTFLGNKLPQTIVDKILGFCTAEDIVNLGKCENRSDQLYEMNLVKRLKKCEKERDEMRRKLDIPINWPLTQSQKELLSKLIRNRQSNLDSDGLIVVNHLRGKPTKFLEVPSTQQNSSAAASSTKVRRAKLIERLTNVLSKVSGNKLSLNSQPTTNDADVHTQMVTLIKRNKDTYAKAAEDAGLKIVGRFRKETVLALRSAMTQTMWRMIRRTLNTEIGRDVFMTEDNLKHEIQDMEFEYECGTFKTSSGDEIQFVRVVNLEEVVRKTVQDLKNAGFIQPLENVPDNTLWIHLSADKGGKSTKLILQIINVNEGGRHSIKQCKLLGFFEGKDNRQNLEEVFGPTVQSLKDVCEKIETLKLQRPDFTNLPSKRIPAQGKQIQKIYNSMM